MDITSKWEMDGSLSVVVIGTDGGTTIEVRSPGCVNVTVGGYPYIGTAIEIIEGLPAKVKEVAEVWAHQDSIRRWLLRQVELEPLDTERWELRVSKSGLYWIWYLQPSTNSVSLAVTLYLDTELPPSGVPTVRHDLNYEMEPYVLIDRYLCIEVRDRRFTGERVIPLHRVDIPHDVPVITMDTLKQCMAGDSLNISSLCDTFDLRFPIDRGT